MEKVLTIGRIAKTAGVPIDTIRYYERRGLIPPSARKESGYRLFQEDTVPRLGFIKNAQALGFTLEEIKDLLSLRVSAKATCADIKKRAVAKIDDIVQKIAMLQLMQRSLKKISGACSAGGPKSECPILEELEKARDSK